MENTLIIKVLKKIEFSTKMGMREGWGVGPIGENSIIFCLTLLKEADYRISVCSNICWIYPTLI